MITIKISIKPTVGKISPTLGTGEGKSPRDASPYIMGKQNPDQALETIVQLSPNHFPSLPSLRSVPVWRGGVSYEFINRSGGMLTPVSTLLYQHDGCGKNTGNHGTSGTNGVSGTGISRHRGFGSVH